MDPHLSMDIKKKQIQTKNLQRWIYNHPSSSLSSFSTSPALLDIQLGKPRNYIFFSCHLSGPIDAVFLLLF